MLQKKCYLRKLACWGVEEKDKAHELLPQSQRSAALFQLNNIFPSLKEPQKLKYVLLPHLSHGSIQSLNLDMSVILEDN